MKGIFFCALLFLLSCTNAQEQTVPTEGVVPIVESNVEKSKTPTNYIVLNSRTADQIEANYPYDIALLDAKGDTIGTDQIFETGKPTVLLFWLTTCVPCAYEMTAIQEKYADWQQEADFNFYAISTDFAKNFGSFQKRVTDKQFPWASYNDVNREFRQIMPGGLNGLPQTFLLDASGEIVYHKRKYRSGDEDKLFAEILKLHQ